jgi:ketosteroid isomerase-like protein
MSAQRPTARTGRSFGSINGPITVELTDLDITADDSLAYGHSIQRVAGTDKHGKKLDLTVRVTDVYKKINGNWLVIHEHVSVPVDLDTGKPDLTSKP